MQACRVLRWSVVQPPRPRPWIRLLIAFAAVFLFYGLLDGFAFFETTAYQLARRDVENPLTNVLIYAGAYLISIAALVALYGSASRILRGVAFAATALSLAVYLSFKSTNGYGFTFHEASLIWSESELILDALRFFSAQSALPIGIALALVVGLALLARFLPRVPLLISLGLLIASVWLGHRLLERTVGKVYQSPIPHRVLLLTLYAYNHRTLYYGEREAPFIEPGAEPVAPHIVFVMDESIAGDLLEIQDSRYDTTPFLRSISDRILDFGIAASASNLSSTTSLIVQSGLRPDQFPDSALRSLKNPNLFTYMQRAGFRSYLLDSQHYSRRPTNLMSGFDLAALDGHIVVRDLALGALTWEMDFRALDYLVEIVTANERSFTYVLKTGAHFPYGDKYPPEAAFFQPTFDDPSPGGNREKTLNTYRNALRWTVDHYLRELIDRIEATGREVVVVYTSDHGQSVAKAADDTGAAPQHRPKRWPHGLAVDPPLEQAMVPLLVFGINGDVQARLMALYDPAVRGRVSGFEYFPTLLLLAGYTPEDLHRHYHHTIFDSEPDRADRFFVSGNLFGMGGGFYNHPTVRSSGYANPFPPPPQERLGEKSGPVPERREERGHDDPGAE
jgi:glucan phosphoethanolaminetransferase (alkaline phosphatase superfamily)